MSQKTDSKRRTYTPARKAEIVRLHLADKMPVSDIAEQTGIHTTMIHAWIRAVLAQAEMVFSDPRTQKAQQRQDRSKIQKLQNRIDQKNEVIAELMQENIQAKKDSGEL